MSEIQFEPSPPKDNPEETRESDNIESDPSEEEELALLFLQMASLL